MRCGLFRPVDGASLAVFRICFGLAMVWQCARYFSRGWIREEYVEPGFHFKYFGFGWVEAWPGNGVYVHFAAMAAFAALVAVGLWYRFSAAGLFLTTTHWFLLEATQYNNHYYLECLIACLLMGMPADRVWSLDAWRRRRRHPAPRWVPWWTVGLLRFQIGVVYFFGGLAKLDPDWCTGVPARAFLGEHAGTGVLGEFLRSPAGGRFIAYSGLWLDLCLVPLLLWRRSRLAAFVVATAFHLSNAYLFRIGVFPWFMIAATTLFFAPSWPRAVGRWCRRRRVPSLPEPPASVATLALAPSAGRRRRLLAALGLYVAWQVLMPLRHHLYPGRTTWTDEGFLFAWPMMLRHKVCKTEFRVLDAAGRDLEWPLELRLSPRQWLIMQENPAHVLQLAHDLARQAGRAGHPDAQVRAHVLCSLNGREPQLLVDPRVDLAARTFTLAPMPWIVPLQAALPPARPYGGRLDARGPVAE